MADTPDLRFNEKTESAGSGFAVTPHDSTNFRSITRGIYVGGAGNVAAVFEDGSVVTLTSVATGVVHPLRLKRINSTNTTATSIVGLY